MNEDYTIDSLPAPSLEQENIIDLIQNNHVIVDSVAGCGKTTTIIHAALRYPDKSFLVLMYNKRLKEESKQKVKTLGLHNIEVQNFHSFFVKHYDSDSFTDAGLFNTILQNRKPSIPFHYDAIVVDEAQDLKMIFFNALCKIISDNLTDTLYEANNNVEGELVNEGKVGHVIEDVVIEDVVIEDEVIEESFEESDDDWKEPNLPHLIVLGDKFQNVYKFLGSDERFILYAERVFKMSKIAKIPWKRAKLSISYRLTQQTASFINNCVLGSDRIQAVKEGPKVKYFICNLFNAPTVLVMDAIKKYGHENIFIVSNSVKGEKSPLRHIANRMSKKNIPIFVPNSDDAEIDEKVINGKLVFTTYNQTKGLERDCVFVLNIDEWNPHKGTDCPNAVYVAMTRAKKQLILLHSDKADYANFVKCMQVPLYADLRIIGEHEPNEKGLTQSEPNAIPVTQITEYLSNEVIEKACSYFQVHSGYDGCPKVNIETTIHTRDELYEDVSDITGVMIPAYYEMITTNNLQILKYINSNLIGSIPSLDDLQTNSGISQLLQLSNAYISSDNGYIHKLSQIYDYDWVTTEHLNILKPRLLMHLGCNGNIFEFKTSTSKHHYILGKHIAGSIDCISYGNLVNESTEQLEHTGEDGYRVYEFKCVKNLKRTHMIQLAIYAYLLESNIYLGNHPEIDVHKKRQYILVNLLTGKYYVLKIHLDKLRDMMEFLILNKYYLDNEKDDDTFMKETLNYIKGFENKII
jgi:hypothetical protein